MDHLLRKTHLRRSELEIVGRLRHLIGYFQCELTRRLQVLQHHGLDIALREGWCGDRCHEREGHTSDKMACKMVLLGSHKSSIPPHHIRGTNDESAIDPGTGSTSRH